MTFDVPVLTGTAPHPPRSTPIIEEADREGLRAYHRLRRDVFVEEQGLFSGNDYDEADDDPRTVVLLARDPALRQVLGGVRLWPRHTPDIGWWQGGRLVVTRAARTAHGVGPRLVRAACSRAVAEGALRFDADVQPRNRMFFERLGWTVVGERRVAGLPHLAMRWPIDRLARHASALKSPIATLLEPFGPVGGPGFEGDDAAPVPGSDLVACTDSILPALAERDPEWAGWCAVLVNVNDLAAMGAAPVGLLDAVAAPSTSQIARILSGLRAGSRAWGAPLLGGHSQPGQPFSLVVTAMGRTASPVPGGGGRPGDEVMLSVDTSGGWRPGFGHAQWDSTSRRDPALLRRQQGLVAAASPRAAKDVSMAGIVGTLGMLAEASGCGAVVDVVDIPAPPGAVPRGDWLTCFPGFGMLTADPPERTLVPGLAASAGCLSAPIARLETAPGVRLRWPDGVLTPGVGPVTGLAPAQSTSDRDSSTQD